MNLVRGDHNPKVQVNGKKPKRDEMATELVALQAQVRTIVTAVKQSMEALDTHLMSDKRINNAYELLNGALLDVSVDAGIMVDMEKLLSQAVDALHNARAFIHGGDTPAEAMRQQIDTTLRNIKKECPDSVYASHDDYEYEMFDGERLPPKMLDDLKRLYGYPPYDGPENICRNDAYFGNAFEKEFGMKPEVAALKFGLKPR